MGIQYPVFVFVQVYVNKHRCSLFYIASSKVLINLTIFRKLHLMQVKHLSFRFVFVSHNQAVIFYVMCQRCVNTSEPPRNTHNFILKIMLHLNPSQAKHKTRPHIGIFAPNVLEVEILIERIEALGNRHLRRCCLSSSSWGLLSGRGGPGFEPTFGLSFLCRRFPLAVVVMATTLLCLDRVDDYVPFLRRVALLFNGGGVIDKDPLVCKHRN